ncbi:MAG: DUF4249 domain-containing protein [Bacteroidota bacterium]|nr:DUF4249 domain-containing protein [Bacteroidota bacterium]MDX5431400.1 DUF4249 domain-containing protein [Bacteroidota bacterium]MDX5470128.1 DUF4249 domain-containing protein [Bacteroidota bacterium]
MKRLFYIGFLLMIFFSSCEEDADIALPQTDPKIGLACFISPGQPIQATLVKVQPLFSGQPIQNPSYLTNGQVFISDGNDTIELVLSSAKTHYEEGVDKLNIVEGKQYWIWAKVPLLPDVFATCLVPKSKVASFNLTYTNSLSPEGDTAYQLALNWLDIPDELNYYRVFGEYTDSTPSFISTEMIHFTNAYYTDFDRDGSLIQSTVANLNTQVPSLISRNVTAGVFTCEEHYFRYHQSFQAREEGSPFIEERSLYSNVNNGVGCFGAYLSYTTQIKVF